MRPAMTRNELREKVARAICYSDMNEDVFDALSAYQKEQFTCNAEAALDTIFAALKEPTEDMTVNGYVHCYKPSQTWQAMLSASPLAPKGKEE